MAKMQTTTLGSGIIRRAPEIEEINKAKECVKYSPQGADYLVLSFLTTMKKLGRFMENSSKGMLDDLEKWRDYIFLENESKGKAWSGKFSAGFKNFQSNTADKVGKELSKVIKDPVNIDFAISKDSQFIRGFSAAAKALTNDLGNDLDKLLNAFFAENDLVTKGSTLYEATNDGKIKYENGQEKKADPQKIKNLMLEKLPHFLKEKGLEATVKNHLHPQDRPEAKPPTPQAAAPAAPVATTTIKEEVKEPTTEPKAGPKA